MVNIGAEFIGKIWIILFPYKGDKQIDQILESTLIFTMNIINPTIVELKKKIDLS
jgi:hypothetical protein